MIDKYQIKLTLIRDMLGTNPLDPKVMDAHIIDRQRKLISEKSKINSTVNKYLDSLDISKVRGEAEVNFLVSKLEEMFGHDLSDEQKKLVAAGDLSVLKETFAELDMKGTTVFFWNKEKNRPMIGDHMIYGFLKASSEAIGRTMERAQGKVFQSVSYSQSLINQHVRCEEEFLTFDQDIKRDENGVPVYLQRSLRAMTAQGPRISLARSEVVSAGAKLQFTLKVMKGSPITRGHLDRMLTYGEICGLGQWRNKGHGQFTYEMMAVK